MYVCYVGMAWHGGPHLTLSFRFGFWFEVVREVEFLADLLRCLSLGHVDKFV